MVVEVALKVEDTVERVGGATPEAADQGGDRRAHSAGPSARDVEKHVEVETRLRTAMFSILEFL